MKDNTQEKTASLKRTKVSDVDLVQLARRQRLAIRCILGWSVYLTVVALDYDFRIAFGLTRFTSMIGFALFCGTAWAVVSLTDLMGAHIKNPENWWLGALVPGVQIPVVVVLVYKAKRVFRSSKIEVTFWGANEDQVRKQVAGSLCGKCAYDLTGNMSGVCPECGTRIGDTHGAEE
ncbi:MAG: hypothetical protein GXP29_05270 [Planctomycetes bacterium]|nr:hypothetical protein [Planctomycetota bacterium]